MTKVYVVLCQYEGCEECSAGAHVVGVYENSHLANEAEKAHDKEKGAHLHSWMCDTIELPIITTKP